MALDFPSPHSPTTLPNPLAFFSWLYFVVKFSLNLARNVAHFFGIENDPPPLPKKNRIDIFFQCEKITILSNDFNGDVSKQSQPSCREADESQGGFARLGIPRAKLPCLIICCVLAKV